MKKSIISLVVLMSTLGTTSSFGKTNSQPRENGNNSPRMEQRENGNFRSDNNRNGGRDFQMRPVEHKPEPKPVPKPEPRHHNGGSDVVTGVVVGTVIGSIISSLVK